ncbi:MAG: DUF3662 domain-containing protein [Acidobacteria bacterium]|nr:DUF3662 domain-containing protein [Acidobacteriota bacterium]
MSILDKVRRWIDGETAELVLEQAARDAQVKPRSKAEAFIVKIAREVESVMQNEMVPLPQGTTIIPSEYAIFLSSDDDKEWQGAKRKGLVQGLYHILAERAKEIAGKKKLETRSFVIELRIDGTLEKGEIRVQHSWEDSSGNKTGVLVRPKGIPALEPTQNAPISQTILNFAPATGFQPPPYQAPPPATFQNAPIQQAVPLQTDEPGGYDRREIACGRALQAGDLARRRQAKTLCLSIRKRSRSAAVRNQSRLIFRSSVMSRSAAGT